MKNVFSVTKKILLISSIVVMSALVFTSCKKDKNNSTSQTYAISGTASGSQMVPSVSGNGSATITGTYDPNTRVLTYTTSWTGLSGAPTSGGFYSGASGSNGTLVGSSWTLGTGLSSAGTFSGTTTLTADQASQLTSGNWYYTLGTANNPTGEVRGQIIATTTP
ncbi:MAG: CHRD domain-containing protein [Flavisolibacter sp.]